MTNEVTRISRVVGKEADRVVAHDDVSIMKHEELARNSGANERSVSYTNNVIIHSNVSSNVEIRKDLVNMEQKLPNDTIKDTNCPKDVSSKDKLPPIMSQKSLDFVIDSLPSDGYNNDVTKSKSEAKPDEKQILDDCEVIIKLPNGKHVKMRAVDEDKTIENNTKEKLKKVIKNKSVQSTPKPVPVALIQNIAPIAAGTLIPVTVINSQRPVIMNPLQKIPIAPLPSTVKTNFKSAKRKSTDSNKSCDESKESSDRSDDNIKSNSRLHLDSHLAASKRYR